MGQDTAKQGNWNTGQFFLTTLEDEQNIFWGEVSPPYDLTVKNTLPAGTYRMIRGTLYQISPGANIGAK